MAVLTGVVVLACCYAFRNAPGMTTGMLVIGLTIGLLLVALGISHV